MGRHSGEGGDRRGAHRSEPTGGPIASVTHLLGTTVPKRVQPPRLLNVLVLSGVTLSLVLFGYSTTQIYLRFNEPSGPAGGAPEVPSGPGDAHGGPVASPGEGPRPGARNERHTESTADAADRAAEVSYRTVESSAGTFTGQVTITNTSADALDNWVLTLGFSRATVTSAWDAEWRATDNGVTVRKPDWEGGLEPGGSKVVNFTVDGSRQAPNTCSINGNPCGL